MYLEISNRQSGKTQRLINQIYADKMNYKTQILMGINFQSLYAINKKIKQNNKVHICLSIKALREHLKKLDIIDLSKVRLYVDEFMLSNAFCNQYENFVKEYRLLLETGYFCSSINTENNKVLRGLSEMCDTGIVHVVKFPKGYLGFQ